MAKKKLQAAMSGGVGTIIRPQQQEINTPEELRKAMARISNGGETRTASDTMKHSEDVKALLAKSGYGIADVRQLTPSKNNVYSLDEGSISLLADLIYESNNTQPLVIRKVEPSEEIPYGLEIVDGERRSKAHKLLAERTGDESWYMVPVRCFGKGELSDDDALFMLHSENLGQRLQLPSERAKAVAVVAERIGTFRMENPDAVGWTWIKNELAEQFNVSPRTAQIELNIGRGIGKEAAELYDQGAITKIAAEALAKCPEDRQNEIVGAVKNGLIAKEDVTDWAKSDEAIPKQEKTTETPKTKARKPKGADANRCFKNAKSNLTKIIVMGEELDRIQLAELRNILDKLDPDKQ